MILVLVFRIVLLWGYVVYQEITIAAWTKVWLQTRPVDPNDFFRGDYVTLSYTIADACDLPDIEVETGEFDGSWNALKMMQQQYHNESDMTGREKIMWGKLVYVPLVLSGEVMEEGWCLMEKPSSWLYIKGLRQTWWPTLFGIEKYFVQQGAGIDLEQAVWKMKMQVSISTNGQARIVGYSLE